MPGVLESRAIRKAANTLKMLGDPTRLSVLLMLAEGDMHVGALCERMSQSQPATSHHLALLRHAGLIAPRREGKNNFYGLTDAGRMAAGVARGMVEGA